MGVIYLPRIRQIHHRCLLKTVFQNSVGERHASTIMHREAYIGGKWIGAISGKYFPVTNPADGKVVGHVPDMEEVDTQRALDAAYQGFQTWRKTTAKERSSLLRKWYNLLETYREELARIVTAEAGKPLSDSRGEIAYGSSFLEWYAEEAKRIYGEVIPSPSINKEMILIREPIGVVSLITPWNFPSAMITRKAGAALAAGCACVIKPAEETPLSAVALAYLADKAGIPSGVINVVTTSRQNTPAVGKLLCTSPLVAGLSFTGSSPVGQLLYEQCSAGIKKVTLELGGNAPFIVFDSADLHKAVEGLMAAKFRNTGQACISANRIFIQSGIYDKFVTTFREKMAKTLVMGNGLNEEVNQGTLITESQLIKIERIVNDAVHHGAEVVLGGKRHSLGGLFYEPTLLVNVSEDMACFKEEIFGPVVAIKKFETEEQVLRMANSSNYGLAGYFFSQDISQVWRVARRLETGMIGINEGLIATAEGALGGIKQSGIGREGSKHGIDEYTNIKYLCIGAIE